MQCTGEHVCVCEGCEGCVAFGGGVCFLLDLLPSLMAFLLCPLDPRKYTGLEGARLAVDATILEIIGLKERDTDHCPSPKDAENQASGFPASAKGMIADVVKFCMPT